MSLASASRYAPGCGVWVGAKAGTIRLGPLLLTRPIGQGGMGTVWHARHPEGVDVAVKVLRPEFAADPELMDAFKHEVRAVASLDHPGIVRVFDYGVVPEAVARASGDRMSSQSPWLAMEYAEGGTLGDRGAVGSWPELRDLVLQILDGLAHSHARDIVHRDLKPRNVLVHGGNPSRISLTDFGIAHAWSKRGLSDRAEKQAQAGTPGYMAPEQIRGEWRDLGPGTDLYALGCLAWRLATGRGPFGGESQNAVLHAQLQGRTGPFEPVFELPVEFEPWLRRLISIDPATRFPCAADAASALLSFDWGGDDTGPPPIAADWRPRYPPTTVRPNGTGLALFLLRPWPLVGRDKVRDTLWSTLRQVASTSRARCVVLSGPQGMGRSRLASWLAERAVETGAAWALKASNDRDRHQTLARAARALLRIDDLSPAESRARLARVLADRGSLSPGTEAADLTAVLFPDSPRIGSRPIDRQLVYVDLFDRLAWDRPLVLVIDDLQWAPDAAGLLARLVDTERPVLAVATLQPDRVPPEHRELVDEVLEQAEIIELGPLSDHDQRRLVDGGVGLRPRLAERLVAQTGGNPSLAVRSVSDWARRGLLVPTSTGFDLRDSSDARLPDVVTAQFAATLEVLEDREIEVLELLATLGGSRIREEEWRSVCREAGLGFDDALLAALTDRGLVRSTPEGDLRRWSIEPAILRTALIERASDANRLRGHHDVCATVLLALPRSSARERAVMHLVDAGHSNRALLTLRDLIDETSRQRQHARLPALLGSELRLLDALRVPATDPRRLPSQLDAPDVTVVAARELWKRAVALGNDRCLARASRILLTLEDAALTLLPDDPRLAQAEHWQAADDDLAGRVRILRLRGEAMARAGEATRAEREFGAAFELSQAEPVERARVLLSFGELLAHGRRASEGYRMLNVGRDALLAIGERVLAAEADIRLSRVARHRGELAVALEHARRARAELANGAAAADLQLGLVHLARGELAQARADLQKVVTSGTAGVSVVAMGGLLACETDSEWSAWDDRLAAWKAATTPARIVGRDTAWPLEWAGKRAEEAGSTERAVDVYGLAERQYALVGDADGMGRTARRLKILLAGAPTTGPVSLPRPPTRSGR